MPIETALMHDDRVFMVTYSGQVTPEEVRCVIERYIDACNKATQLVHSVNDSSQMIGIPVNIVGLRQSPTSPLHHPKRGKHVIVTSNEVLRATLNTANKVAPGTNFICAYTLEEAWQIMYQILADENEITNS